MLMLVITKWVCQTLKIYLKLIVMLILVWFVVCIIFFIVQLILEGSGHALEVFALLTAIALFLINKLGKKKN